MTDPMITAANTLEASPKPSEIACALCGSDPARGNAIVYDDKYAPVGQAIHLCHGAKQKISCYVQWTVYGARPSKGVYKASERFLDDEDRDKIGPLKMVLSKDRYRMSMTDQGATVDQLLQALETLRTHLRRKYYGG